MDSSTVIDKFNFKKISLGFWIYLMTDAILFSSIFAVYIIILSSSTINLDVKSILDIDIAFFESIILLTSSFILSLALIKKENLNKLKIVSILLIVFSLGLVFLSIEINEFSNLLKNGLKPDTNAYLSSFFTLVGIHGLHVAIGLIWSIVLIYNFITKKISNKIINQLKLFTMYWHFLDLVWIFIFAIVYMYGASQ